MCIHISFTLGKTYFFHRRQFWMFNDEKMMVEEDYPQLAAMQWMECKAELQENTTDHHTSDGHTQQINNFMMPLVLTWTLLISILHHV